MCLRSNLLYRCNSLYILYTKNVQKTLVIYMNQSLWFHGYWLSSLRLWNSFNPNWYELRKQEEFPSLASSRNIFFQDSMCLAKYQINPIDVNFHLQKSLEIFDTNSADKIWSIKDRGWKVPCLMPIRVNGQSYKGRYFAKNQHNQMK